MAVRAQASCNNKAELIAWSGYDQQSFTVFGNITEGDSTPRFYYYDASSTANPDGETVLPATGMSGVGRYIKTGQIQSPTINTDYTNSASVSGGAGQSVFYLTSDKTPTGSALYPVSVDFVAPIINDANNNYTYGWSYNATTKALTVTAKISAATNVALLGISLLGVPVNVANGTQISVLVKGK